MLLSFVEADLVANLTGLYMKKNILHEVLICLLMLLFVYAGSSKLLDIKSFSTGMRMQPFPLWLNTLLTYTLPVAEIMIALGLGFGKTRIAALYAYTVLMLCFTGYTGLVIAGFFKTTPCGCGGIISGLSWGWHFIINLIFFTLTCIAIRLQYKSKIVMHNQGVSQKPVKE